MKKTLICLAVCLTLAGRADALAGQADILAGQANATVTTSFYPVYCLAVNLLAGVPGVTVRNLAAPGTGCLHDYTLQTGDMRALAQSSVFLINGAGMEGYLAGVFQQFPDLPVVDASQGIALLPSLTGETEGNPHLWLDAQNAIQMADNLAQGLTAALPAAAEIIEGNRADYTARLAALDEELRQGLQDLPHKDIITFHEAFPYFAKAYGLNVAGVVAQEPGESLSPAELKELVDLVRSLNNPPLFTEPQYADLAAQTIAQETGAQVYALDPVVTGPQDDGALTAYEDGMRRNMAVLRQALQ